MVHNNAKTVRQPAATRMVQSAPQPLFDVHLVMPVEPGRCPYFLDAADMLKEAARLHAKALREAGEIAVVLPAGLVEEWVANGSRSAGGSEL